VCNGVDLVQDTAAHEQGALVALAQRTRIGETACIDFDLKARGCFQLRDRQFVGGCWEWGRGDPRENGPQCCLRCALRPWWRSFRRGRWLLGSRWPRHDGKRCDDSGEQKLTCRAYDHDNPPFRRPFPRRPSRRRTMLKILSDDEVGVRF